MAENQLDNLNYFDRQNEVAYMSYSQFKDFVECEAMALAILEGRYEKPKSDALLQGSYVDAYFSGELDQFKTDNPSLFKKDGTLLAKYEVCESVIKAVEEDPAFKAFFLSGETQRIFTGFIAGVPFKGKIDMLYDDRIVDMKCMADIAPKWNEEERRKVPFYTYYGYQIQAAIYQELVRLNTGKKLPYYLAVMTKTDPVEKHAFQFSQEVLDKALMLVKTLAPHFQAVKNHEEEPTECGHCKYFASTHKFDIFDIKTITEEDM